MEYQYLYNDRVWKYMPQIDALGTPEEIEAQEEKLSMGITVARLAMKDKVKVVQNGDHGQMHNLYDLIRHYLFIAQKQDYLRRTKGRKRENLQTTVFADCLVAAFNAVKALGEEPEKESCSQKYRDFIEKGQVYCAAQTPRLWKLILWPALFVALWALICRWITGPSSAEFLASSKIEDIAMGVLVIGYLITVLILWMKSVNGLAAVLAPLIGIPVIFVLGGKAARWVMTQSPAMAEALKDTDDYFFSMVMLLFLITLAIALAGIKGNAPALWNKKRLQGMRQELVALQKDEELANEVFCFGLIVEVAEECDRYARDKNDRYSIMFRDYNKVNNEIGKMVVEFVSKHFKPLLEQYNKIARYL